MIETGQWVQCFWSGETDMMGHNLSCPDIKCECKSLIFLGNKGKILHNLVVTSCPHDICHKEKQFLDSETLEASGACTQVMPLHLIILASLVLYWEYIFFLASYLKSWNSPSRFLLNPALIFPTFHYN